MKNGSTVQEQWHWPLGHEGGDPLNEKQRSSQGRTCVLCAEVLDIHSKLLLVLPCWKDVINQTSMEACVWEIQGAGSDKNLGNWASTLQALDEFLVDKEDHCIMGQ